jgi:Protein of unknown function (DUF760)
MNTHDYSNNGRSSQQLLRLYSSPPFGGDSMAMDFDDDDDDDDEDEDSSNNIMDAMKEEVIIIVLEDEDDDNENGPSSLLEEDDDDDEEEEVEEDPYTKVAASEFQASNDDESNSNKSKKARQNGVGAALTLSGKNELDTTMMDWGGALSTLRERVQDVETGKSQDPSHVLFRMMSSQTPNQIIGQFVSNANPMVVQAMSGAISSLLGGLCNPNMGVETIVKASGEKIGSLCFQLQMTGTCMCIYQMMCVCIGLLLLLFAEMMMMRRKAIL